jgi:hypothetical protein
VRSGLTSETLELSRGMLDDVKRKTKIGQYHLKIGEIDGFYEESFVVHWSDQTRWRRC